MTTERIDFAPEPDEQVLLINDAEETAADEVLQRVNASQDQVRDYLRAIGKRPVLVAEQEIELSKDIEAGLLAKTLLAFRAAPDPLEYLESLESVQGQEVASAPEEFTSSLSYALGKTAAKLSGLEVGELEMLVQKGDESWEVFYESNLRLVVSIAKKYTGRGMPFMDLIQEGNLGLRHALEMFDFAKGYKFSTYSSWWIRQSIIRAMANQSRTIRLPVHVAEKVNRIERAKREMLQSLGRDATVEELAREMDMAPEKLKELLRDSREPISLDTPLGDGNGVGRGDSESYFSDLVGDVSQNTEETATDRIFRQQINAALDTLTQREADILRMRYGIGVDHEMTLDEIAPVIGVTRERVRQIQKKALDRLLHNKTIQALHDSL